MHLFILLIVGFLGTGLSPRVRANPIVDLIPARIQPLLSNEQLIAQVLKEARSTELQNLLSARVLTGGKRFRPFLCFAGAAIVGVEPENVSDLACIAECTHCASLVHDDIIDDAKERRGQPTLASIVGHKPAVLVGDWLLAYLSKKARKIDLKDSLMDVIMGMTEGEFLQRELRSQRVYSEAQWEEVALLKTGLLFSWSFTSAATQYGAQPELRDSLNQFGILFGEVFQQRDDLDDAFTDKNEINFVHLKATDLQNASSSFISDPKSANHASTLGEAVEATKHQIRMKIEHLSELLEKIRSLTKTIPTERQLREECLQSLTKVLQLLSPSES